MKATVSSPNHWWQNWPKTHAYVAQKMFFPTSADEIASAVQAAEADGRPVRAVGGGWSFSDASLPGMVTTNRPNAWALDAMAGLVPVAETYPMDPMAPSIASIPSTSAIPDAPMSLVMLFDDVQPPTPDPAWSYLGLGIWTEIQNGRTLRMYSPTTDRDFLNYLGSVHRRPIRNPMNANPAKTDTAGSLVMFDLNTSTAVPSRDWYYHGGGVWTVGVSLDSWPHAPDRGTLDDLSHAGRLTRPGGMTLSPKAARPAESLSLLLAKEPTVPAMPEPVYLINTRSLVASLQQDLPSILCQQARNATASTGWSGLTRQFLFHVEAGITIAELGELLAHQSPRLSLQAISGSPGATLAGALSTATHGAEFNWKLLVDRVKAVHLVGPGGLHWWIEGDMPIVDPQKLRAAYPDITFGDRIIRGTAAIGGVLPEDWLSAVVVSMGTLGVLYSVVLEVVPLFGVHEAVVQRTWRNLGFIGPQYQGDLAPLLRSASAPDVSQRIVKLLQRGNLNGTGIAQLANQYADLAINPNKRADGDYDCWIGNRELTAQLPIDSQPSAGMLTGVADAFSVPGLTQKFGTVYGLQDVDNTVKVGADLIDHGGKYVAMIKRLAGAADLVDVALDTFLTPMTTAPNGVAVAQAVLTGILSGLLNTANTDRRSDLTGVSVGALGFPASGVMGTALEIALGPVDAFGFLQTEILDHIDPNEPFLGYVSIRLCSTTKTLMGMQQFGDAAHPCSVMIEVVGFATPGGRDFIAQLQKRTVDRMGLPPTDPRHVEAMLHWGLENDQLTAAHLRTSKALQAPSRSGLSKLATFIAVRTLLHAAAGEIYRAFDNSFTERLGLSSLNGLVFCDDMRTPITTWKPTRVLAQTGSPLLENTPTYLEDLNLLNESSRTVEVSAVRFAPSALALKLLTPLPLSVGAGQLVGVEVQYTGAPVGPLTGFVEVDCDRPIGPTLRIPLASVVIANRHAELQLAPLSFDLGRTPVGTTVEQVLTISNVGTYDASFPNIEVVARPGEPSGQFTVHESYPASALPSGLAPAKSIPIRILYAPTARGVAHADLRIDVQSRTDALNTQYAHRFELPLTGSAHMPIVFLAAGPQRRLQLHGPLIRPLGGGLAMPALERAFDHELQRLDFGPTKPGTTVAASFWIRNTGDDALTVEGVSFNQLTFNVSTSFPAVLQPDAEMEVVCSFMAPPVPGMPVGGTFQILSNDPLRPSAALAVTGRASGPHLREPSELLDLGIAQTPRLSPTLIFSSDGTDAVTLRDLSLATSTSFVIAGAPALPADLAPGSDLQLTISLVATQPGHYEDTLRLLHNGKASQSSIVLLRGSVP